MRKILFSLLGLTLSATILAGCRKATVSTPSAQTQTTLTQSDATPNDPRYVNFSPDLLSDKNDKKRVLFFYASWCPTCNEADPAFKKRVDEIPENAQLIKVHYNDPETTDQEKALAKTYNITYQHTFVQIDEKNQAVAQWNGDDIDNLLKYGKF